MKQFQHEKNRHMKEISLCPHCKEKMTSVVKVIKRPDAPNQNAWNAALEEVLSTDSTYASLELVDTVCGNDESEESYNQALALVDQHPDLKLIMAPTTVGIAAAAIIINMYRTSVIRRQDQET